MHIKCMISLIRILKFHNLCVQLLLRNCLLWLWSYTTSSIWLHGLVIPSLFWFWFYSFLNLHIWPWRRLYLSNSHFRLLIHIARVLHRRLGFSESLFRLRTSVLYHFYPLLHLLNRSTSFHLELHLWLVVNGNIVVSTWRRLFLWRKFFGSIILSTVISLLALSLLSNFLQSSRFRINLYLFILCLLRLIVIWRNGLLSSWLASSPWSLRLLFLSRRFALWSSLWKTSIDLFDHDHFFLQTYYLVFSD